MTEKPEHKQGCDALGGYGQGVGPCSCGAAGLLVGEVFPAEEDTFDVWFEQYRMQTWLSAGCDKDRGPEPSAAWGLGSRQSLLRGWLARAALTPHAPAQAIIERLEAKLQEQALQYLSDNGQWIEETERLTRERDEAVAEAKEIRARWNDAENEFAAIKAKQVADIDEVMRLAERFADFKHDYRMRACHETVDDYRAAREALRSHLAKDRT